MVVPPRTLGRLDDAPHDVEASLERARRALDALEVSCAKAAWLEMDAGDLAFEFRRILQAQPALVGRRLASVWIEEHNP